MLSIFNSETDIDFLTLPEGCPYSRFNEPLFPSDVRSIKIEFPKYISNYGRSSPHPDFANFFPGTDFSACVTLTVIDDNNFEGNEMVALTVYTSGPDFELNVRDDQNMTLITITDEEGEFAYDFLRFLSS